MDRQLFSHTELPIEKTWLLESIPSGLSSLIFLWIIFPIFPTFPATIPLVLMWIFLIVSQIIIFPLRLLTQYLIRANFEYRFFDNQMVTREGIFSKTERTLQYSTIQNIVITRSITDRLYGLANLSIENASMGGFSTFYRSGAKLSPIGSIGNSVNIPGLSIENAEYIKTFILFKIINSPSIRNQTHGL